MTHPNEPKTGSSGTPTVSPAPPARSGGPRRDALVLIGVIVAVSIMIGSAVVISRRNAGPSAPGDGLKGDVKGSVAPDFELASLSGENAGKNVKLSDLRGKAVLLNFWATWCEPCKIEMPWFEDLHKKYAGDGLEVVGVAMDDSGEDAIKKFAKEMGVTYTILQGKERVGEAYGGVQFLPTTFYIDRNGKVVDRVFGIVSKKELEDNIKKTLAAR